MSLILALVLVTSDQKFDLKFVSTGISKKMGYVPQRALLGTSTDLIKKKPSGLSNPRIGTIELGASKFAFILDEPAGADSKLYVDSNADGDLTNDPAPKWAAQKRGDFTMYMGSATVKLGKQEAGLGIYRFDPTDPQRAQLKDTLLWYADFGYEGKATFGKSTFPVVVSGLINGTARIWVDRNNNKKSDGRSESISAASPFNFDGTTYELKAVKDTFEIIESEKAVAEIPLPPDLSIGLKAPTFSAIATDGSKINFPETFKGKVVMLDFWATWCGPCIAELPNVVKAYEKYHDKGLEILGVSFDKENMADKVASFTKEHNMPWKQVYEGKFWSTTLGAQYGVEGIPFCLLVEGDTGKIIATVDKLRGENLDKTLNQYFAQKK